jgi:hypothetical protein
LGCPGKPCRIRALNLRLETGRQRGASSGSGISRTSALRTHSGSVPQGDNGLGVSRPRHGGSAYLLLRGGQLAHPARPTLLPPSPRQPPPPSRGAAQPIAEGAASAEQPGRKGAPRNWLTAEVSTHRPVACPGPHAGTEHLWSSSR